MIENNKMNIDKKNLINKAYKLLDKGFLRVVDLMGSEESIVQAARVSYGKGTKTKKDDRALIRYLMKHRHTSPFEMCEITLHIKAPIFIVRQWVRHRTANFNEYSARYSEMHNEFYYPSQDMLGKQSLTNKQCSKGTFNDDEYKNIISQMESVCKNSYSVYCDLLSKGVARESARGILPINIYTEFYWKIDAHNLMHFLKLRLPENAQQEIREYAVVINNILAEWMPSVHEAFDDYILSSKTYSKTEVDILNQCIDKEKFQTLLSGNNNLSTREISELLKEDKPSQNK